MGKLNEITRIFKRLGKGLLPAAVIQNGTMANEKFGIGHVETIASIVEEQGLGAPAIIILGEVVKNARSLRSTYQRLALETAS